MDNQKEIDVIGVAMRWQLKGFIPGVDGVSKAVFKPWVVLAKDYDELRQQLADALHRRDTLGKAIGDAALKAGIVREGIGLTGLMLLMLADDIAECLIAASKQEAEVSHERDLLRSLLKRVIDSSVLAFEQDGLEQLESLEADICAALKPSAEEKS